ncbi:acyltransferase [Aeromonas veronii]|uniref:acyltransferase n=1 Tax=Aeromonas veronii TaxID=654 RepID=UPI0011179358|nr:acyltransferase family protein [Aeromonas veronii]
MNRQHDGIHVLRTLSCFMVILLHISATYYYQFSDKWNAAVFFDCFTKACVPVFIMITGYLSMDNQVNAVSFYRKRFGKIALPILFFSLVYYLMKNDSIVAFPKALMYGPTEYHLWYMYMLCGLYLIMPFLQKIWFNSSLQEKTIIVGVWFFLHSAFPALNILSITVINPLDLFYLTNAGLWGYVFLGAYLKQIRKIHPFLCFIIFVIPSALMVYSTKVSSEIAGTPTAPFMYNLSMLTLIASVGIFMGLRDIKMRWLKPLIIQASRCSFGIYLIHVLIIKWVEGAIPSEVYNISPWLMMPLIATIVFSVSLVIIYLLRRVKFVEKLVG